VGQVTPPTVTASAPVVVTGSTVALDGTAASDGGLRDVFVSVQDLSHDLGSTHMPIKVFYLASPGRQARMSFQTNAPLQTGSNLIRVTARSAEGVPTTTSLIVLRTRR
jgi:hypothetical protein